MKNIEKPVGVAQVAPARPDFTLAQAERVVAIMSNPGASGEEKLRSLLAEFDDGLPANGRIPVEATKYQFESIIDQAWKHDCEEVLLHMVDVDPKNSKYMYGDHCNFMFPFYASFPRVIDKLRAQGYTMAKEIRNDSSLGLYLELMSNPARSAMWSQMAAEGLDMNGHALKIRDFSETLFIAKVAEYGTAEVLEKAIAAGCDPRKIGKDGHTILHAAIDQGQKEAVSWKEANDFDAPRFAGICDFVARTGLDIDMRDASGQSALHLCAKRGYAQRAKILLEHGADPYLKDDKGRTPQRLAKAAKRDGVLEVLNAWRANDAVQKVLGSIPGLRGQV
jgi:hypothetical protein